MCDNFTDLCLNFVLPADTVLTDFLAFFVGTCASLRLLSSLYKENINCSSLTAAFSVLTDNTTGSLVRESDSLMFKSELQTEI
jgi:hypothetical protein